MGALVIIRYDFNRIIRDKEVVGVALLQDRAQAFIEQEQAKAEAYEGPDGKQYPCFEVEDIPWVFSHKMREGEGDVGAKND